MNIHRLETFVAVAMTGSFSKAAEEMYTTQATVSKHISSLEKEMDVKLFTRSARNTTLTAEGETVLEYARKIISEQKAMADSLAQLKDHPIVSKSLPLLIPPVYRLFHLDLLFESFRKETPSMSLQLYEQELGEMLGQLMRYEVELGFVPEIAIDKNMFECITFATDRFMAVMLNSNKLAKNKSLQVVQLKNEKFICLSKTTGLYDCCVSMFTEKGFNPQIMHTGSHPQNIVNTIKKENYVAITMSRVATSMCDKDVIAIPLEDSDDVKFSLVRIKGRVHSHEAELFWEYAKQYFSHS